MSVQKEYTTTRKAIHAIGVISIVMLLIIFAKVVLGANAVNASEVETEEDTFAVALNPERDYLTVVNDQNEYIFSSDYDIALKQDIIYLSDCYEELTPVEKAAGAAFTQLKQHLDDEGIDIQLFSAYRTREDQQWVYDYYSGLEGWGDTNKVAKPGFSEHHTGLL